MSVQSLPRVTEATRMIPDLLREHPAARRVLDRHGLIGCGGPLGPHESLRFFARAHGIDEDRLLDEIDEAIARPAPEEAPARANVADAIYRPFFLAGIAVVLTAGATWGAWILWNIGLHGSFLRASVHTVNAHGEAQIYGWVGLFIMGFAYQAFPRMWQTMLPMPWLAVTSFVLMLGGIALRTLGLTTAGDWGPAIPTAALGGMCQIAAATIFAGQVALAFRRSAQRFEPYVGFVTVALACFVLSCVYSTWHTWHTMIAPGEQALVAAVATYQLPLRDLQVHGLALFMILGVSLRMLPGLFGLPKVDDRRAWWSLGLLSAGLVAEIALFLGYRWSGNHLPAAFLPLAWLAMTAGAARIMLPWRLWRPLPEADRSGKFVRLAYLWLAIAMGLLLFMPLYHALAGLRFSHAYFGAARHAITVGFVSLMIMGIAAKVVPTLNGIAPGALGQLWGPFLLVNVGCTLRVTLQILTDWDATAFALIGVSGTLEVIALAWWGLGLVRLMVRGMFLEADEATIGPRPERIEADHLVGDVVRWYPRAVDVLAEHGFEAIRNSLLRRTLARQVTIEQAARLRGTDLQVLLAGLNRSSVEQGSPPGLT